MPQKLKPELIGDKAKNFEMNLRRRVVGQDEAIQEIVKIYQAALTGLARPGHPIANFLFLGPTGSGKTRVVEAMAESLFGVPSAMVKIDCAEFRHSHEIAKLIGSPPGYLGHRETNAILTQEALNAYHAGPLKLSIVLFDEIEKSSPALWDLLLGILDKAVLTLGDNTCVDFSRCVIFMTSNVGAREMSDLPGIGFTAHMATPSDRLNKRATKVALEAARCTFNPEFMNRIDKLVVFHSLSNAHLKSILDIELGYVQERIYALGQEKLFVIKCSPEAKSFLLREGTDSLYGARHLARVIERHVVYSLSNLIATDQVRAGDTVHIHFDEDSQGLVFSREAGYELPVPPPKDSAEVKVASAHAGLVAYAGGPHVTDNNEPK